MEILIYVGIVFVSLCFLLFLCFMASCILGGESDYKEGEQHG
jgi:hypothetical protein